VDVDIIRAAFEAALPGRCSWSQAERLMYRTDLWPRTTILKQWDLPAGREPVLVAHPESEADLERCLALAREHGLALIPYGGGSGVVGDTLPVRPSVMVDLKRMARVLELDPDARVARVEAGKLGQELELELRARGWTLGHYPSSIHCSTVGGYAATRSAGQFSSRYGKFEDMIEGLRVLTPARGWLELDRATEVTAGPGLLDAVVGSEGTLGLISRVDLRLNPAPEEERYRGLSLGSVTQGLAAMRALMQAGLRPSVLRLYDPLDSWIALRHGAGHGQAQPQGSGEGAAWALASGLLEPLQDFLDGVGGAVQRRGLREALKRAGLLNGLVDRLLKRTVMILGFEGRQGEAAADMQAALHLLSGLGAQDLGEEPGLSWLRRRYSISFKMSPMFRTGAFVDTMEVATSWSRLEDLYLAVRRAVSPHVFIMAHFSHAYRDGCSIYFTFSGTADSVTDMLALYDRVWDLGPRTVLSTGGTLSHHHGVGLLKARFLGREVENGGALYRCFKALLDPEDLLNPGKLWSAA
jgi:alkyldihydroxyacetonephosphate synthase